MWYLEEKNKKKILSLIKSNKTPFYVYHKETLLKEVDKYIETFKKLKIKFLYAFKANSNKEVCLSIKRRGFGADVVSGGELGLAIELGFDCISFSGVGKTSEELEFAIKNRIFFINIESYEEFLEVKRISEKLRIKTNISVRINPEVEVETHNYIKTAKRYSKFGVDFKTAIRIYTEASKSKYLNIKAVHFHLGSQIFKSYYYRIALKKTIKFVSDLRKYQVDIKMIDIGGGLGVKEGEYCYGHENLFRVIKPYIDEFEFVMEPGRSVVASCGVIVSKVIYRKKVGDRWIVILDAGMNNIIRPALYGAFHPVLNLFERSDKYVRCDIAGPLCESSDFFGFNLNMSLPQKGDIILIVSAGAYAYSMSSNYNLRGFANEIVI